MKINDVNAKRKMMISPLIVIIIATVSFGLGYTIGMFHVLYYWVYDTRQELKETREKYVTFTRLIGKP